MKRFCLAFAIAGLLLCPFALGAEPAPETAKVASVQSTPAIVIPDRVPCYSLVSATTYAPGLGFAWFIENESGKLVRSSHVCGSGSTVVWTAPPGQYVVSLVVYSGQGQFATSSATCTIEPADDGNDEDDDEPNPPPPPPVGELSVVVFRENRDWLPEHDVVLTALRAHLDTLSVPSLLADKDAIDGKTDKPPQWVKACNAAVSDLPSIVVGRVQDGVFSVVDHAALGDADGAIAFVDKYVRAKR